MESREQPQAKTYSSDPRWPFTEMRINLDRKWWKTWIAEFLGSFFLNFYGCGALVASNCYGYGIHNDDKDHLHSGDLLLVAALVFGGVITCCIFIFGSVSGCHLNPAVTVALMTIKMLPPKRGFGYVLMQFLGCAVGSIMVWLISPQRPWTRKVAVSEINIKHGIGPGQGFAYEFLLTLVLMFAIVAVTDANRHEPQPYCPSIIGIVILTNVLCGALASSSSMNPARTLGSAIISNYWDYIWIYFTAPFVGSIASANIYKYETHMINVNEVDIGN